MVDSIQQLFLYHIPNYILSALFWTLLGRFILVFFISKNPDNYIYKFFCRITDWYLVLIRPITPKFIAPNLLPFYAIFILLVVRFVFWIYAYNWGLIPKNVIS